MDLSICIPCFNRSTMLWPAFDERRANQACHVLHPLPDLIDSLVKAVAEAACAAEIIVADYQSTDWPLHEWLPERARPIPACVVTMPGEFSVGEGKNAAANASEAPILFFCDSDMIVPAAVITRGLEVAALGKGYFPLYQREHEPGGGLYWGAGHGCCIVQRDDWLRNPWAVGYGWTGADEDTKFANWFMGRGLYVRERQPGLIHRWHPLVPSKIAADLSMETR